MSLLPPDQTNPSTGDGQPSLNESSESNIWSFLESLLDKFPKVPVDFAIIAIMYLIVIVACLLMVTALRGLNPHMIDYAVYTFLTVTGITISVTMIYLFGYRLKKK